MTEFTEQSVLRLLEAGRRRIAWMDWSGGGHSTISRDERVAAFERALASYGVAVNPQWIRRDIHPNLPGAGWEELREIWVASKQKPDGLVIGDETLLRSSIIAIQELGIRVPEQLLVISHVSTGADMPLPFPIWFMEYDPDEFAARLADKLLKLLRHEPVEEKQEWIPFKWVMPNGSVRRRNRATEETPAMASGSASVSG